MFTCCANSFNAYNVQHSRKMGPIFERLSDCIKQRSFFVTSSRLSGLTQCTYEKSKKVNSVLNHHNHSCMLTQFFILLLPPPKAFFS